MESPKPSFILNQNENDDPALLLPCVNCSAQTNFELVDLWTDEDFRWGFLCRSCQPMVRCDGECGKLFSWSELSTLESKVFCVPCAINQLSVYYFFLILNTFGSRLNRRIISELWFALSPPICPSSFIAAPGYLLCLLMRLSSS